LRKLAHTKATMAAKSAKNSSISMRLIPITKKIAIFCAMVAQWR
jgi:hypothetical protein